MKVVPPAPNMECPLPDVLNVIGDKWTCAILHSAMFGTLHFEDFQSALGIARNILSKRLARLVEQGIMTREVLESDKRRIAYRLTRKGWDLVPVMAAARQWIEYWDSTCPQKLVMVDRQDRLPIRKLGFYAHNGRPLGYEDIVWLNDKGEEALRLVGLPRASAGTS